MRRQGKNYAGMVHKIHKITPKSKIHYQYRLHTNSKTGVNYATVTPNENSSNTHLRATGVVKMSLRQ